MTHGELMNELRPFYTKYVRAKRDPKNEQPYYLITPKRVTDYHRELESRGWVHHHAEYEWIITEEGIKAFEGECA